MPRKRICGESQQWGSSFFINNPNFWSSESHECLHSDGRVAFEVDEHQREALRLKVKGLAPQFSLAEIISAYFCVLPIVFVCHDSA